MTEAASHKLDETQDAAEESAADQTNPHECYETVDPNTREEVLREYDHRCQSCGRRGPERGGFATLHVHHIERNPAELDEHDLENLTLLCKSCHSWLHQQSTSDDAPVELTEEDLSVLLPQDIEILQILSDNGPARTGDIAAELTADLTVSSIRERLWVLMGLDNKVESRDQQLINKDVETGEWGLAEQVENTARGHIPDDPQLLLQRMEDEQVRQALVRGCDRDTIADVLGVSRRTTFNKEKRANAFDFPFDAFYSRGGRPSTSTDPKSGGNDTEESGTSTGEDQQRLDSVTNHDDPQQSRTETWGSDDAHSDTSSDEDAGAALGPIQEENGEMERLKRTLRNALDAIEAGDIPK